MATSLKITTIEKPSQREALDQTLRAIKSFADSRRTARATSDRLTKARDAVFSAFENRVFSGSDTVKSAMNEMRAYRLVAPATSISTGDPVKLAPIPQPVQDNPDVGIEIKNLPH